MKMFPFGFLFQGIIQLVAIQALNIVQLVVVCAKDIHDSFIDNNSLNLLYSKGGVVVCHPLFVDGMLLIFLP